MRVSHEVLRKRLKAASKRRISLCSKLRYRERKIERLERLVDKHQRTIRTLQAELRILKKRYSL